MFSINNQDDARCDDVRKLLSEYVDSTLSARRAWEVEKHLTGCGACSEEVRQLQATIQILRSVPRLDTSDTFMAALHARLDTVDPAIQADRSPWRRLQGWFLGTGHALARNRVPALSLGLAAAAVALMVSVRRPVEPVAAVPPPAATADSVHVSIASSASSPFSDPAADNLEYRLGGRSPGASAPF